MENKGGEYTLEVVQILEKEEINANPEVGIIKNKILTFFTFYF
jgi:hypothetical protein